MPALSGSGTLVKEFCWFIVWLQNRRVFFVFRAQLSHDHNISAATFVTEDRRGKVKHLYLCPNLYRPLITELLWVKLAVAWLLKENCLFGKILFVLLQLYWGGDQWQTVTRVCDLHYIHLEVRLFHLNFSHSLVLNLLHTDKHTNPDRWGDGWEKYSFSG